MTGAEVRQLARFLAAFAALVAVTAIAPLVLLVAARRRFDSSNPLSGVPAPWHWKLEAITDALADPLADDLVIDLIVRICLVVLWVAIVVITVTTLLEVVHLVRHRGMSLPSIRGLGWAQPLARSIAAGLLVLVPLLSPRASLAGANGPQMVAPVTADLDGTSVDAGPLVRSHLPAEVAPEAPHVHVVQQGESVFSIAESLAAGSGLTTAAVADLILDENLGRVMNTGQRFTNPAYIEVAWELVIPGEARPHTTSAAPNSGSENRPRSLPGTHERVIEPDGMPSGSTLGSTHIVQRGETLSGIAEQHFGDADRWPRLWDHNAGTVMNDGRSFDDPHLILPGWVLAVPTSSPTDENTDPTDVQPVEVQVVVEHGGDLPDGVEHDEDVSVSADVVDTPSGGGPVDDGTGAIPPTSTTAANTPSPTSIPTPAASPTPTPTPAANSSSTQAPNSSPTPTSTVALGPASPDDASDIGRRRSGPDAPSPVRLEHAGLLAAGILALAGLRRRQRLRRAIPRTRIPQPRDSVVATERRLRTIDRGERSARVDVALRSAAHALADTDSQIGLVTVGLDGDVEVLLTSPAELPAPWTRAAMALGDDGAGWWQLAASIPVEMISQDARRVGTPCVALLQLGVAGERDVLVDLEACGTLAIEARAGQADEVVTALAAGLASSPYAEIAHLIGVSLPTEALLGHRNAHRAASVGDALELAASLAGSTVTNERSSFSLRSLRTGGEMWEPAVVLLLDQDVVGDASIDGASQPALPAGGRGLAVVASVESAAWPSAPARLVAESDGWTLHAFGSATALSPVGVSAADLADVVEILDEATAPLIVEDDPAEAEVQADDDSTGIALDEGVAGQPFEPMEHEIIVRLMGPVDVLSRRGDAGVFERSKTVELIAWLATHRERSTRTAARTALWELDVRDATFANVVSEARRALGRLVEPDGDEEWLARTLTEQLPLHAAVVTDAQLMEQRLARARLQSPDEAIGTLRPAAEMIRGMPFAGTSYLWPDAEGITSNFVLLATGVTTELAAHALSLGDVDLVFWATGQGLKVLPGHEALIALRMRAHARAGDLAGVRQEWESYERVIVADAWSDGEPAPKLVELRHELLSSPT